MLDTTHTTREFEGMLARALPFEQSSLARRAGTVGLHRIPNNGTAIFTETYWPPTSACYSLSYDVLQRGPCYAYVDSLDALGAVVELRECD